MITDNPIQLKQPKLEVYELTYNAKAYAHLHSS
ncbi:MAG: hypothetical protein ACJAVN_001796, partial [Roseivirga sp.]